jgi:hypothetical protein
MFQVFHYPTLFTVGSMTIVVYVSPVISDFVCIVQWFPCEGAEGFAEVMVSHTSRSSGKWPVISLIACRVITRLRVAPCLTFCFFRSQILLYASDCVAPVRSKLGCISRLASLSVPPLALNTSSAYRIQNARGGTNS